MPGCQSSSETVDGVKPSELDKWSKALDRDADKDDGNDHRANGGRRETRVHVMEPTQSVWRQGAEGFEGRQV